MKFKYISKKFAVLVIIFMVIIINFIGCKEEKQEIPIDFQEAKNGLTVLENYDYVKFYKLDCNQDINQIEITDEIEFYITEDTEKAIRVLNYKIWEYKIVEYSDVNIDYEGLREIYIRARKMCETYGFTADNLITSEWVVDNPKEAISLIYDLPIQISNELLYSYKTTYELILLEEEGFFD